MAVSDDIKALAGKGAPWKKGIQWWVVLLEGIAAAALGFYVVLQPESAGKITLQLIGGYLLVIGIIGAYRGLSNPDGEKDVLALGAAGAGVLAGLLALLFPRIGFLNSGSASVILALGLLAMGGIGIYEVVRSASQGPGWDRFLISAVQIVLAVLLFISNAQGGGAFILALIGWIALLSGGALMVYAYTLYRTQKPASPISADTENPTPSQ